MSQNNKIKIKLIKKYKAFNDFNLFKNKNFVIISFLDKKYKLKKLLTEFKLFFLNIKKNVLKNLFLNKCLTFKLNSFGDSFIIYLKDIKSKNLFFNFIKANPNICLQGIFFESKILESKFLFYFNKINFKYLSFLSLLFYIKLHILSLNIILLFWFIYILKFLNNIIYFYLKTNFYSSYSK